MDNIGYSLNTEEITKHLPITLPQNTGMDNIHIDMINMLDSIIECSELETDILL